MYSTWSSIAIKKLVKIMKIYVVLYKSFMLQSLFGWIFMPLAWVMGVDWAECGKVGQLIGLKTILNEFVAYEKLSEMLKAGELSVSYTELMTTT